ncbi:MAG: hypothetical protein Q4C70_03720 [Planctomycetia bacterium]|nr:hypothetical protein [Planctomycetia bacterium]
MSQNDIRTYRGRRHYSRMIFGIGLVLILGWQLCQKETWNLLQNWNDPGKRPPEILNRQEDIKRTDRVLEILSPEMLEDIQDKAPVNASETRTVMKIWNYLNVTDINALEKASLGKVLFAQYLKQPGAYRGCTVRIQGTVRLAMQREIPEFLKKKDDKTDYGYDFDHFYELWIQPDDNLAEPVLVNTLEIPEGIALDEPIQVPIVIDGVFFKLYLYEGAEGMETAPCFYAKAPIWYYLPQLKIEKFAEEEQKSIQIPFIYILGGAFFLGAFIFWIIEQRTKPIPPEEPLPEKFELPQ